MKGTSLNFIEALNWRYATKKMNGKNIPTNSLDRILEAIRLAPTSSGMQPYEIFVISNNELKEKIRKVAFNQTVITECSHLLVFAAWDAYTPERINKMTDLAINVRGGTNEFVENYRNFLLSKYPQKSAEESYHHAAKQAYIALAFALAAAALENVDSTPMEGFDIDGLDELLDLKIRGLRSVVIMTLGYRDANGDWLNGAKKVRRPKTELFRELA